LIIIIADNDALWGGVSMDEKLSKYLELLDELAKADELTRHRAIAYQITVNDAVTKLENAEKRGIEKGEKESEKKTIETIIMAFFKKGNVESGFQAAQAVGYSEERTQELLEQAQKALNEQQGNDSQSMSGPTMNM
jgi:ribosomal protein L17